MPARRTGGPVWVKRRPSGAADLGLLIAQQRTSGDGRSPSEKCQNPTPEFRPPAGLSRVSGAIFRRSNRMAQTRNLLRPSVCKKARRPGQLRSQGVPLPTLSVQVAQTKRALPTPHLSAAGSTNSLSKSASLPTTLTCATPTIFPYSSATTIEDDRS